MRSPSKRPATAARMRPGRRQQSPRPPPERARGSPRGHRRRPRRARRGDGGVSARGDEGRSGIPAARPREPSVAHALAAERCPRAMPADAGEPRRRRVRRGLARPRAGSAHACAGRRGSRPARAPRARGGSLRGPVHLGVDGAPEGRRARAPQRAEPATWRARAEPDARGGRVACLRATVRHRRLRALGDAGGGGAPRLPGSRTPRPALGLQHDRRA